MNYRLIRDRRKRLSVLIDEQGEVIVRAPIRLSQEKIDQFLEEKQRWIEQKRVQRKRDFQRFSPVFSMEQCMFLGKLYSAGAEIDVMGSRFRIPSKLTVSGLKKFYIQAAGILAEKCCQGYPGYPITSLKIGSFRRKWGSCDGNGQIRLCFRLAMLPFPLFHYVIIHELCHLRELNHSSRFWKEVEALCPDFRSRKKELQHFSCLNAFL